MLRLLAGIGCGGVEVVGACVVVVGTCCLVVGSEVFISDGDALCGFDVDERYGVVWFACSVLLVVLSEVSDAQCLPVDAEVLAVFLMLGRFPILPHNSFHLVTGKFRVRMVVGGCQQYLYRRLHR